MTMQAGPGKARIGFLFNHDELHQIAHSAPIAFELSKRADAVEVVMLSTCSKQLAHLASLAQSFPGARCRFQPLKLSTGYSLFAPLLDPLMPYRRVAMLLSNRATFAGLDALVVPEKTSLLLRSHFGLKALRFVYTSHGAGDRAVGFDRHSDRFDLAFMSGPKIRDRLMRAGLARDGGYAIIGYPKFDLLAQSASLPKLFDNDRPTVLYNPHFSPKLSSWYRHGLDVLDYFYHSDRYNLIFAPHVMMFRKRLHVATDGPKFGWPGAIPEHYRKAKHLLIDLGSARSIDMSYTRAADLYLGDVSSQVYEFLHQPRPCLFLNSQGARWQDNENYGHWQAGPVIDGPAQLDAGLREAFAGHAAYRERQQAMFAYTFDLREQPSSQRAASAILDFLAGAPQAA